MTTPATPDSPEENNPQDHQPLGSSGDNVRASWNFSLHDVRSNMSKCSAEARETMIAAFLWAIDPKHPVTLHEFAKSIDYDRTTVWKIYVGKYVRAGSGERLDVPAKMVKNTQEWLRLEKERFIGGGKGDFVMTPTAKRIFTACDLARESQSPVFLWGPSHVGKTWALENYTSQNNHGRSIYVRMKAASGLGGMVRRINERLGNSDRCNTEAAVDRIKRALRPNMLLSLDELHLLVYTYRVSSFFACLEVLREIYDEVGCGMILCGTDLLMKRAGEAAHGELEQLFRRGVHKVQLPGMPTKGDLTAILEHNGLEFPDVKLSIDIKIGKKNFTERPYEMLRQIAKEQGLKAITERLRYGRKLAARSGEDLSWKHLVEAHILISSQTQPEQDWD